jgi:hypothetical protein
MAFEWERIYVLTYTEVYVNLDFLSLKDIPMVFFILTVRAPRKNDRSKAKHSKLKRAVPPGSEPRRDQMA